MAPNAQPLDVVTVLTALFTALMGREMAGLVGPYAVIILGAILGASLSTSRRPPAASMGAVLAYTVSMVGMACLFTVPLANLIAPYFDTVDVRWFFGPVATLIGSVGTEWGRLLKSLVNTALKRSQAPVNQQGSYTGPDRRAK